MYTYNPFDEKPVWDGVMFLKSHHDIIEALGRVMISMKQFEVDYLNAPMMTEPPWAYQDNDEFAGSLIWQIRAGARSYYNHWMLRHMIRVMVKLVFGVDPLIGWAIHYANKLEQPIEFKA